MNDGLCKNKLLGFCGGGFRSDKLSILRWQCIKSPDGESTFVITVK